MFLPLLLGRVGSRFRGYQARTGPTAATATPTPATSPEVCTHPAAALTSRPAGRLSRTWIQTCQCGKQWTLQP
ncbi:hypothetical protein [Parafrankia sp. FMc2]|uniref:hypothetical protein n=1 Tax=Parafrankia sp. FMc2 TaxID=3233196 RepID=UPI0034D74C1A